MSDESPKGQLMGIFAIGVILLIIIGVGLGGFFIKRWSITVSTMKEGLKRL
ncbi:hypothetical protein KKH56_05295 [bacterium]|nr:hypothetical protein [bacterium]